MAGLASGALFDSADNTGQMLAIMKNSEKANKD
jgi:hypothetical protein